MVGFNLIILSTLSFALSNCLWLYPLKRIIFLEVIIIRSFLTSILFIAIGATGLIEQGTLMGETPFHLNIIYAVLLCIFSFFGLYFFVKSLKNEQVGIAVPVSNVSSFFGVATAIIFLKDQVTSLFWLSFILAFVGVAFVNNKPIKSFTLSRGIRYNLYAAFFWGVSFALFSYPVREIGAVLFSFILESTVCICSIILFRIEYGRWSFPLLKTDKFIVALALFGFSGVIFYNLSFRYLPVSTISLLSILTPAISVVISAILFKERLRILQYLGIVVIILSLSLLKI